MGALRTIARNVASNFAGYLVNAAVAFFLTPFVIDRLGPASYGIWVVMVSCTGYYGLLDLGIRSAVGQYVTRYWSKRDLEGINRTFSTALVITAAVGVVLVFVTGTLAFVLPTFVRLDGPEQITATRIALLIMGCGVAVNFPLSIFASATYATQRFDIANAIGIAERLLAAALYVWVLVEGFGLVGLAVVNAGVITAANLVRMLVAFRLIEGLAITRRLFKLGSVKELSSFGVFSVLSQTADVILRYSDAVIIILIVSHEAVTVYNVSAIPQAHFIAIVNAIAWTLTPYATACDARRDEHALRRLWMTGSRAILLVAALVAGGLIFLGRDFLALWVGEQFVSGRDYVSSATILSLLAVAALTRSAMTCGKQILFGLREVRFLAKISFAEALLNVGLSVVLLHWIGLIGAAVATLTAVAITQVWLQPSFLAARLKSPLGAFYRRVPWGGALVLGTMGLTEWLVRDLLPVDGWPSFLLKGVAVATPAFLLGGWFGTTRTEKDKVRDYVLRLLRGRDPFTGR